MVAATTVKFRRGSLLSGHVVSGPEGRSGSWLSLGRRFWCRGYVVAGPCGLVTVGSPGIYLVAYQDVSGSTALSKPVR